MQEGLSYTRPSPTPLSTRKEPYCIAGVLAAPNPSRNCNAMDNAMDNIDHDISYRGKKGKLLHCSK